MALDLPPLHDELAFLAPLSEQRATGLVAWLTAGLGSGTLLDIGCGWGELLLRVAEAAPACHVVGVDTDETSLQEARRRASARGLADRVNLLAGDAEHVGPAAVDALVCIGATQVWGPPVEAEQPLDYGSALDAIRGRVRDGGRVVYADGIWSRPPTPEAVARLAGRDDEFVTLDTLCSLAEEAGFEVAAADEATPEEWDAFEAGFAARYDSWLAHHSPGHPDAALVRQRVEDQRASYVHGYRGVLGMGYLQLVTV
jgi:cyclopropane fatty-acyl-phospholipid synthase-like methyltransferase